MRRPCCVRQASRPWLLGICMPSDATAGSIRSGMLLHRSLGCADAGTVHRGFEGLQALQEEFGPCTGQNETTVGSWVR